MQWIKAHLNVVIAGSVSLLSVVALVLGIFLTNVAEGLSKGSGMVSQLQSAPGFPRNALDELRQKQISRHETLVKMLAQTGQKTADHKPLPGADKVFPKVDRDNQEAPFQFKQNFSNKQKELLALLKAQDKPTKREIDDEETAIIGRRTQEIAEQAKQDTKKGPAATPAKPAGQPGNPNASGVQLLQLGPDATPEELVREVPEIRAAMFKAHRKGYLCYASESSLDPRPRITNPEVQKPQVDDMWGAQVALWIEEDILGALAGVNEEKAKTLPEEDRWVGKMPFKRLVSFVVGGYVPEAGVGQSMGGGPSLDLVGGLPPMESVSKRGSKGTVDVIQFSMRMVVEAKALPTIIDKICESGFYTVLQINYETLKPYVDLDGYVYGDAPVIEVWMLCEGSLLRTNATYAKLMPESVKKDIAAGKVVGGGGSSDGGGPNMFNQGPRMGPVMDPRMMRGPMMGPGRVPYGGRTPYGPAPAPQQ